MLDYLHEKADKTLLQLLEEELQPAFKKLNLLKKDVETFQLAIRLDNELIEYLQELPVICFNSSKYYLNLVKRYFFPNTFLTTHKKRQ